MGPTTLAFPARPSHPPRLALLVAYLFYNIANQDGCANIIATGTQRILTQTEERRRERESRQLFLLPCLHFSSFTAKYPHTPNSPLPTPAQCARGSITLLAQFRGWLAPSPSPPLVLFRLPSRIEPFVVVYLFCKQFQHFVHSLSPSPSPLQPTMHYPAHRERESESEGDANTHVHPEYPAQWSGVYMCCAYVLFNLFNDSQAN